MRETERDIQQLQELLDRQAITRRQLDDYASDATHPETGGSVAKLAISDALSASTAT